MFIFFMICAGLPQNIKNQTTLVHARALNSGDLQLLYKAKYNNLLATVH